MSRPIFTVLILSVVGQIALLAWYPSAWMAHIEAKKIAHRLAR
jgi:hypothetical protein